MSDIHDHLENHHAHSSAKYIKNIVYGGMDGIITTFSIIAACFGANLEIKYIISMGIANLFADAFSMGFGDYLSGYFEGRYILSEKKKELYELEHNRDYEINEMIELYQRLGLSIDDSKNIVDILGKNEYKDIFINRMVDMELDLKVPDLDFKTQIKKEGLVTFLSFFVFGLIPNLIYIISYWSNFHKYNNIFIIDCFITLLTIISLGYYQSKITKQPKILGTLILTINGLISTTIAFLIGYGLERIIS